MPIRTAAIVGLNWGLVHLRGLREAGCEVVALAATDLALAQQVAGREGVPRATSDVSTLQDVDVVVIATPASTHVGLINALPRPYLICEKPLRGLAGAGAELPRNTSGRLLVNYAFTHLATAGKVTGIVAELGPPEHAELGVDVHLPLTFSPEQWFLETASHPLSWLLELFGPPRVQHRDVTGRGVELGLICGQVPVAVRMRLGGRPGIEHRVQLRWPSTDLVFRGSYRPGHLWSYEPVRLGSRTVTDPEWSPTDCWLDANAASVAAMLGYFRGAQRGGEGLAFGLFDERKASWLESVLVDRPQSG